MRPLGVSLGKPSAITRDVLQPPETMAQAPSNLWRDITAPIPPHGMSDEEILTQLRDPKSPVGKRAMDLAMQVMGIAPFGTTNFVKPSYRGLHEAPLKDSGAPLHDLTGGGRIYPDDVYGPMASRYYGHGADPQMDARLFYKIQSLRGKPDEMVDVFRAVPKEAFVGGKQPKFEHGDWVTISRRYAVEHGESALNGNYKIMRARFPAKALFTNGDSAYEFGLDRSVLEAMK